MKVHTIGSIEIDLEKVIPAGKTVQCPANGKRTY
jgi:hypothetical protein